MRRKAGLIFVIMVLLAVASCHRNGRLISRGDMSHIYADMLLADQWLQEHRELRRTADTTLFYEPIFNSYGYSTKDYLYSVEYYLDDPVRYSRILKKTSSLLGARVRKIKAYQKALAERDASIPPVPWEAVDVLDFSMASASDSLDVKAVIDSINRLMKVNLIK